MAEYGKMKPILLGAISIMSNVVLVCALDSYQQGCNQGTHMFAQNLNHHFICPYNDTGTANRGYDPHYGLRPAINKLTAYQKLVTAEYVCRRT